MRIYFDSTQLRESERRSAWRQATHRLVYSSDGHPHANAGFEGRLRSARLGHAMLTEVHTSELDSWRSRTTPSGRDQRLVVSLLLQGEWQLEQDGRAVVQRPGDIVLWDSARPFHGHSAGPLASLVLGVPLPLVQARGHCDTRLLTTTVVPAGSPLGRLAGDMVHNAAATGCDADSPAASRLGAALLDVACSAVELQHGGGDASPRQRLLLRRAQDFMRGRLEDALLDVDSVAGRVGVSPRTLGRLFAAEGTTVMGWLRHERLEASRRMLQAPGTRRVADVALACGFTNFAHFSHSFRKAYGMAPATVARGRRAADG